jgi:hypothetical protein
MEVHPPHQPLHSWKDFWIHLGTITIGLLIAIGLEQSVEALHHHHERRVLEADLRTEAGKNLILMDMTPSGPMLRCGTRRGKARRLRCCRGTRQGCSTWSTRSRT